MVETGGSARFVTRGGPASRGVARVRAARRRVALLAAPQTARGKRVTLTLLVLLTAVIAVLTTVSVQEVPPLSLVVPVVLGGFLLDRGPLRVVVVAVAAALLAEIANQGWDAVRVGSAFVLVIIAAIAVELVRDRERLGLSAGRGETMLLELRDQLRIQGELPVLVGGWRADVAQRSAGGSTFGGDFIVSHLGDGGRRLELVVVDVSGKGVDAGTRALLLSGALGGLLGAVRPERFMVAANDYLLRQRWDEGFATAVHAAIDLETGGYLITNAGHPPVAHYAGGSGRWQLLEREGMVLGLSPDAEFGVVDGRLQRFDALLLYTDGLVEVPGRDLSYGIDRLLGAAEGLIPRGFAGGAQLLVDAVAPQAADDRAVVLLWRD